MPEHDQELLRREAEAAAAPNVVLTPEVGAPWDAALSAPACRGRQQTPWAQTVVMRAQVVSTYLDQVLRLRLEELGEWPEVKLCSLRTLFPAQVQQEANGSSPAPPRGPPERVVPLQELLPGQEPLLLEGFIAMGRSLPESTPEAQHIAYKLLYDATNEAIINVYRAANRIRVRLHSPGTLLHCTGKRRRAPRPASCRQNGARTMGGG